MWSLVLIILAQKNKKYTFVMSDWIVKMIMSILRNGQTLFLAEPALQIYE